MESEDPDSIDGVMEEFMVHLARAVKDTQVEEKCCYHCSSPRALYPRLPIGGSLKEKYAVKLQGGGGIAEGSLGPSDKDNYTQESQGGGSQGITQVTQTPFLNPDPFQHWNMVKNVAKVKINRESCMALLDNGM